MFKLTIFIIISIILMLFVLGGVEVLSGGYFTILSTWRIYFFDYLVGLFSSFLPNWFKRPFRWLVNFTRFIFTFLFSIIFVMVSVLGLVNRFFWEAVLISNHFKTFWSSFFYMYKSHSENFDEYMEKVDEVLSHERDARITELKTRLSSRVFGKARTAPKQSFRPVSPPIETESSVEQSHINVEFIAPLDSSLLDGDEIGL